MSIVKRVGAAVAIVLVVVLGVSSMAPHWLAPRQTAQVNTADPALIEKGRYLAEASDCVACHTARGGAVFAGGVAFQTPVGTIYSSNITSDKATGIGAYDYADFERAIRHGYRKDGAALYPVMPYVSYAVMTDADVQALYAYFASSTKPVAQRDRAPVIKWPVSMRWPLVWWQMMFDRHRSFAPPANASPDVVRGAYLVQGAGHCGACHTPRGAAMQEKALQDSAGGVFLSGSELEGWYAKSLRNEGTGLASWSLQDIADFVRSGRNGHAAAFGSMVDVVQHSTQHLTEPDALAIAAYLKVFPARPDHAPAIAKADDTTTAKLLDNQDRGPGALGYVAYCAACHHLNGQGTPRLFPSLAGSSIVLSENPSSLIQITLAGGAMAKTPADIMRPSMPELGKLSDAQIADILTFIRSSWGNKGSAVAATDVAAMRNLIAHKPDDYLPSAAN